jgi:phenylalanyl-tRNA synthetase beta chain
VVVAQIKASEQHPNADRLSVCQVDDGSGQLRQIVCGAKNYHVGDKVPLALPGAVLPHDLKIKASRLRGVESQGMLCSARELNLAEDAAGLLILSPKARVGAPLNEILPNDTILDLEITPNRADLLSHYGLAREIAALTRKPLRPLEIPEPTTAAGSEVQISAPNECPFYSARRIEDVRVGPSPDWLRARLEAVGIRPINNIVDIGNIVMLEIGQPLHVFDADRISGGINVRLAQPNEKLLALDGRTYQLRGRELLIADAQRAVGIAGVMGGEESGVSKKTRNILLESAYFLPSSVRRTSRELSLPSDASYRFERGVDPGMVLRASNRASQLLREIAGGQPAPVTLVAGNLPAPPTGFSLRYARCQQVVGAAIPPEEVDRILEGFSLEKLGATAEQSTWKIPTYRSDLRREIDLIEEIARVFGINRVTGTDRSRFTSVSSADRRYDFEMRLRRRLAARGFSEARTSALVGRQSLGKGFVRQALELRNPLSEDQVALRPSLFPGLIAVLERNLRNGVKSVRLFELGRVFQAPDGCELRRLGLLVSGEIGTQPSWRDHFPRRLDLFDLKGALASLDLGEIDFHRVQNDEFALGVEVSLGGALCGLAGQLASGLADAPAAVFVAELDLPNEVSSQVGTRFADLQRFPSISRDIALIVPESVSHEQILAEIRKTPEPLLASVELFDLFTGTSAEAIGAGRKSLAYSLTYRDKNRTLTASEVSAAHDRIRERLRSELGVELRE